MTRCKDELDQGTIIAMALALHLEQNDRSEIGRITWDDEYLSNEESPWRLEGKILAAKNRVAG